MLKERSDGNIEVFILWAPILASDNRSSAQQAVTYLPDERATHYWDLWSFGINWYAKQLAYPDPREAWDIFVIYRPGQEWSENLPEPATWMQHRNLDIGPKYSKDALARQLDRFMK